jgi:hypothetical protein
MLVDLDNRQACPQNTTASRYTEPASRAINAPAISAAHPDPVAKHAPSTAKPSAVPAAFGRPKDLGDVPLIDRFRGFQSLLQKPLDLPLDGHGPENRRYTTHYNRIAGNKGLACLAMA